MNPTRCRTVVSVALVLAMSAVTLGAVEKESPDEKKKSDPEQKEPDTTPDTVLKVGVDAPNFKLERHNDAEKFIELKSFEGKKPVVLIFGSYT
ncbi:MAG: hypothetical protein GXP29_02020 [Planctomycetes bacterium]|nr:hypothetical protein [Planctomycetota bacterium]